MGRLSHALVSALQSAQSVAPNAYATSLRNSVADVEAAELTHACLTKDIDEQPRRWTVYPELVREVDVASDHHVIWAKIDL